MLILQIRILSSPLFVFFNSLYLFISAPRSGALNLSGITCLFVYVPLYPSFPHTPTLWPVSPTYITMCLEKTAVYLHGSFPCMCFIVDFLRVSGLKRYGF